MTQDRKRSVLNVCANYIFPGRRCFIGALIVLMALAGSGVTWSALAGNAKGHGKGGGNGNAWGASGGNGVGNGNGGGNGNGAGNADGAGGGDTWGYEGPPGRYGKAADAPGPGDPNNDSVTTGLTSQILAGQCPNGQCVHDKREDREKDKEKWLDKPPQGLGLVEDNLSDYVKRLDPVLEPGAGASVREEKNKEKNQGDKEKESKDKDVKVKKVKDNEPNGKAVGWSKNDKDEETAARSVDKRDGAGAGRKAVDPESYSRREVLAVGLTPSGEARARQLGYAVGGSMSGPLAGHVTVLMTPHGVDALHGMNALREELPGEHFELNRLYRLYRPAMKRDDSEPGNEAVSPPGSRKCVEDHCYGRTAIQWKEDLGGCARGAPIGMLDTDVDLRHPAFAGQKIKHQSFRPEGKNVSPNWHGTGVLALLAGRPDSGTPGLIPDAEFFVGGIFFNSDDGETVSDTVSVVRALEWMGASGVKLVNMSIAGPSDELMRRSIEKLSARGVAFTAAAGNEGPSAEPSYPAAYPQVIAVTAVSKELQVYPSANRGAYIDLAAPGVRIWTAAPDGREGYRAGTSFATPFATAVLALQQPEILSRPKAEILGLVPTVSLGAGPSNATFGRGLVQAPAKCPGGGTVANQRLPSFAPSR